MNKRHIIPSRDTHYQAFHDLWWSLPPPASDHPEDLVHRDDAAMAEVAPMEQAFDHPAAASSRTDAPADGVPATRHVS